MKAFLKIWIALALPLSMAACSSDHGGAATTTPNSKTDAVPKESFVGVKNAHEVSAFYTATTGISPTKNDFVRGFYTGLKASLSDGHSSSVTNNQAALDLALAVCMEARRADEGIPKAQRKMYSKVNFGAATSQFDRLLKVTLATSLLARFSGQEPSSGEVDAAVAAFDQIAAASPTDSRTAVDAFCAVIAGSALGAVSR